MKLQITMMGRSYDASSALPEQLEVATGSSVDEALQQVARLLPQGQDLPASCLVVLNGKHLGTVARHDKVPLAERDELVIIAPVAGG